MSLRGTISSKKENQAKFAQDRVTTVEKYYGLFCETLGSFIRKSARLRDRGDIFAKHVKEYADLEQINTSSKINLVTFAENFSAVQDYRDAEVQRLEVKVLKPLMLYGKICKDIKTSVKKNQNASKSETKQLEKLEKLQQKVPPNVTEVAQQDLQKLRQERGNFQEQLIADMDKFEKEKLTNLKSILAEFVKIEMMFHARALKYLSECYQAVEKIDTDADMDLFRARLLDVTGMTMSTLSASTMGQMQLPHNPVNYSASAYSGHQPAYTPFPQRPGVQGNVLDDDEEDEDDDDDFDVTDDDEEDDDS
ncbi:Protein fam92a [Bulinus truncatus]|nr:Protein fam92a [Bulinus truncatus]